MSVLPPSRRDTVSVGYDTLPVAAVEAVLRGGDAVVDDREHRVGSLLDQDLGVGPLTLREVAEHVVGGILATGGTPHADAHPGEIRRAERLLQRPQAVVAGRAPA